MIRQVITRTNSVTGRPYFDEKAIMAWETGNELEDTNAAFLQQTAAWIKSGRRISWWSMAPTRKLTGLRSTILMSISSATTTTPMPITTIPIR